MSDKNLILEANTAFTKTAGLIQKIQTIKAISDGSKESPFETNQYNRRKSLFEINSQPKKVSQDNFFAIDQARLSPDPIDVNDINSEFSSD